MPRRTRTGTRNTTADLFARIAEVTLSAHRGERPTRRHLAERWRVTPRAVSYVLVHAREIYGVEMESDTDPGKGYTLVSAGVLNVDALGRWKR